MYDYIVSITRTQQVLVHEEIKNPYWWLYFINHKNTTSIGAWRNKKPAFMTHAGAIQNTKWNLVPESSFSWLSCLSNWSMPQALFAQAGFQWLRHSGCPSLTHFGSPHGVDHGVHQIPRFCLHGIEPRSARSSSQHLHLSNHGGCDYFSPNVCVYIHEHVKMLYELKIENSKIRPPQESNTVLLSHIPCSYH
jgi:hypothetical protein